ncbi:MAG: hypothetical protein ABIJ75_11780, partial [Actinomycetota bacterium]
MAIDQNAGAGVTPPGSPAQPTEDSSQAAAGLLTGKTTGPPQSTPPLAASGTTDQQPPGWVAALTSEQRANTELIKELATRFPKGAPELVQHYVETKTKTGVSVPNEQATAEEWATYRKAMGVPEKPTDYKLEKGKAPAGLEYPDARVTSLKDAVHQAGLTQTQAEKLFLWDQKSRLTEALEAAQSARSTIEQVTGELKAEWKGDYQLRLGYMEKGAQYFFERYPGLADKFSRTGLANDAEVIKMFAEIGRMKSPSPFVEGRPSAVP